jgi:hypothetical protein
MNEHSNGRRLPPPAFPPGSRRHPSRIGAAAASPPQSADHAFIAPDDPLPPRMDAVGAAFISPDEPMPQRRFELAPPFRDPDAIEPGEEGQVVGMNLESRLESDEIVAGGDPHVMELMHAVANLSEGLHRRGEAALREGSGMTRLETTLRAYCAGYLAGRRAEELPAPILDEALPTDG